MIERFSARAGFWRKLAYHGARYGPRFWVRYSPPVFGITFGALLGRERALVRHNLRRIHGRRSLVTESFDICRTFASFASCFTESLALQRPEAQSAECRVLGAECLKQAIGQKSGVILVTAHAGPWDAAARLLSERLDAKVMLVMKPEADGAAGGLHDRVRQGGGVTVLHVGTEALDGLPLLRHLRAGGVVALQLDRSFSDRRTLATTLFGEQFLVPRGPFQLAALARAPILPVFARRIGYFRYELSVGQPLWVPRRADLSELTEAAKQATVQMERFLRSCPTQWFHFSTG